MPPSPNPPAQNSPTIDPITTRNPHFCLFSGSLYILYAAATIIAPAERDTAAIILPNQYEYTLMNIGHPTPIILPNIEECKPTMASKLRPPIMINTPPSIESTTEAHRDCLPHLYIPLCKEYLIGR